MISSVICISHGQLVAVHDELRMLNDSRWTRHSMWSNSFVFLSSASTVKQCQNLNSVWLRRGRTVDILTCVSVWESDWLPSFRAVEEQSSAGRRHFGACVWTQQGCSLYYMILKFCCMGQCVETMLNYLYSSLFFKVFTIFMICYTIGVNVLCIVM